MRRHMRKKVLIGLGIVFVAGLIALFVNDMEKATAGMLVKDESIENEIHVIKPIPDIRQEGSPHECTSSGTVERTLYGMDPWEAYMVMKIAMAEAESEGVEGKALVILVVFNRVDDDRFPDNISDVIYQKYQFSPISDGRFDSVEPDRECYEALEMVQNGWDESQGALFFESLSASQWHSNNLQFLFQKGNHYFYR